VVKAVRDYLDDQGYLLVGHPDLHAAAARDDTLFGVPYFDEAWPT